MRNYIFIALLLSLFSEIIYSQTSETIVSMGINSLLVMRIPTVTSTLTFQKRILSSKEVVFSIIIQLKVLK
jgi:hypothetical protein